MNKLYTSLTLVVLALIVYINFLVFKSYIFQYDLIQEFNNGVRTENTLKKFNDQNLTIPNITVTTLPLTSLLADYNLKFKKYKEATDLLNLNISDNPYLFFNESVKSKLFIETQLKDSALFYSKRAFYGLPNNISNFSDLSIVLTSNRDLDELVKAFNISNRDKQAEFWKVFLSSLIIISNDVEIPEDLKKQIKSKYYLFQDEEILSYMDIILLGNQNIEKSKELIVKADGFFASGDFLSAANTYLESLKFNPNQYSSYENAALSFMNIKMFKEANDSYNNLASKFPNITPKSNYYYGYILSKLNRIEEACKYISRAHKANYKESVKLYNNICL